MANLKSSKKDVRRIKTRTARNSARKSQVDILYRQLKKDVAGKDKKKAEETLKLLYKAIDKACQRNIYKKNTAARKKSKATKLLK